jgi:pSer/pThr/pTyr-binding forkhead associated (FHA) protein
MEAFLTQTINIGRGSGNDVVIPNPDISRKHAKITFITEHVMLLEDTDSSFGTTVNGQRIERKIIGFDDIIVLANQEQINLKDLFSRFVKSEKAAVKEEPVIARSEDPLDFRADFKKLEKMHEMYVKVTEAMMVNTPRHQAWLRATFSMTPLLGMAFGPFGMAFGVLGSVVGQILSAELINPSEKKLTLEKEFKRTYICPNPACKRFLGFTPYADLVYQKKCSRCKAQWMD